MPTELRSRCVALDRLGCQVDLCLPGILTSEVVLHAVLPRMVLRGRGIIIQIAKQACLPLPPLAIMTTMLLSCSRTLWADSQVSLARSLTLIPGGSSALLQVVRAQQVVVLRARIDTPEQLAEGTLRAVARGQSSIVPGLLQLLLGVLSRGSGWPLSR